MNHLTSLFIDDELSLHEKMDFVEAIHEDQAFYTETKDLISLEIVLAEDVTDHTPSAVIPAMALNSDWKQKFLSFIKPLSYAFAGTFAVLAALYFSQSHQSVPETRTNRFVIYRPDVSKVEITGSFTLWEKVPLHEAGNSGYWEVTLEIPKGVHRFTYILDGHTTFADPTVPSSEMDDFGGTDSILTTEI